MAPTEIHNTEIQIIRKKLGELIPKLVTSGAVAINLLSSKGT